jgi:hypothetical protein
VIDQHAELAALDDAIGERIVQQPVGMPEREEGVALPARPSLRESVDEFLDFGFSDLMAPLRVVRTAR